ncbi:MULTISPECIES: UxaA family hydrolase [unclassified Roseateles]|uniref:UxaA family hydrolase n=1 Tax=unclassified Roseateles TaxID=2626991 RepID=UPI0006F6AC9A|nr:MULTISPECIES: altronate dehydratase family protein [unclassified Roseateles]KQW49769.1 galactonate dehydratase [Pelomonas sp. Root405]KRA76436.1 galactonate dehydratase [Pelomonas sp. Root662]
MSTDAAAALIVLHHSDNVAVARVALTADEALPQLLVRNAIAAGHKIALRDIAGGEVVLKYGQPIGVASRNISVGEHVHSHNLAMARAEPAPTGQTARPMPSAPSEHLTFEGYLRADGRVGTRNYIGVLSSVNCSATVCKAIAQAFSGDALAACPGVDGVVAITHGSGCGMSAEGEGLEVLRRTLRGYATHPNFAGVVLIGLGCEVNQVDPLVQGLPADARARIHTLTVQQAGGTREAVEFGKQLVRELALQAGTARRSPVALSHLVVGLQCGGSDGYSGISANPALGAAVDLLVRHGGTAILSETPEIYGAEHLLTARAASPDVAEGLLARIRWWEAYAAQHGAQLDNNPSPGNKAGGITTILEKSLGAVAKGGSSTLNDVVEYAQPVSAKGLVFMDTPGYDPVSATGQVAGGANLICFTTGRGSTYGCKPTPSLKLATNTRLFERMPLDMDFNAGGIVDGTQTVAEAGEALFRLMLDTASGRATLSEQHGLGDNEFVPWQLGAVM